MYTYIYMYVYIYTHIHIIMCVLMFNCVTGTSKIPEVKTKCVIYSPVTVSVR